MDSLDNIINDSVTLTYEEFLELLKKQLSPQEVNEVLEVMEKNEDQLNRVFEDIENN